MPTLSENARDALVRRQKTAQGVSVTYQRLNANAITLTAIPGATVYTASEVPGRMEISARDYLVAVADLVDAGGAAVVPQIGDRITETINGVAKTFEVEDPNNGEPCWRYSSQWRAMYRIHLKAV